MDSSVLKGCQACLSTKFTSGKYPLSDEDTAKLFTDCTLIAIQNDDGVLCSDCFDHCNNWLTFKTACWDNGRTIQRLRAEGKYKNFSKPEEELNAIEEVLIDESNLDWMDGPSATSEEEEEDVADNNEDVADNDEDVADNDGDVADNDEEVHDPSIKTEEIQVECSTSKSNEDLVNLVMRFKRSWNCPICDLDCRGYDKLRTHINENHMHSDVNVQCELCSSTLKNKLYYKRHLFGKHMRITHCPQCGKYFETFLSLGRHLNEVHMAEIPKTNHAANGKTVVNGPIRNIEYYNQLQVESSTSKSNEDLVGLVMRIKRSWNCPICDLDCQGYDKLRTHVNENHMHSDVNVQCELCSCTLKNKLCYKRHLFGTHMRITHCPQCGKQFDTFLSLGRHINEVHMAETPKSNHVANAKTVVNEPIRSDEYYYQLGEEQERDWKCPICQLEFESYKDLRQHILGDHVGASKNNIKCALCTITFAVSKSYMRHLLNVHMKVHDCRKCGKVYPSFVSLGMHINGNCSNAHDVKRIRAKSRPSDDVPLEPLPFRSGRSSLGSLKHFNFTSAVTCPACPVSVETTEELQAHILEAHDVNLDSAIDCFLCDFKTSKNVLAHIIDKHLKSYELKCNYCESYATSTVKVLNSHYNNTHNRQFCCEVCGERLESKQRLAEHMNSHKDMLTCETCGYEVQSEILFKKHLERHEAKEYNCDLCEKVYPTQSLLRNHRTRHFPEQFACKHCDKMFFAKRTRDTHQQKHHKKSRVFRRSVVCHVCNRSFTSYMRLQTHIKTIHGSKPTQFTCKECGKSFARNYLLHSHIDVHHKK